ncbi:MAG: DUF2314 domain-containing protein [Chloroflexota bacterium]
MKRSLLLVLLLLTACVPVTVTAVFPTSSPVSEIPLSPTADVEMETAFAQAHATLHEFIQRIATPNASRTFAALKVRFELPDGTSQDIWCDNVTYIDGQFTGNMGDDIPALRLAFDDRITIPAADIVDWMVVENDKLIGGFTIRLAYSRMTPEEQQLFLNDAGYSVDE